MATSRLTCAIVPQQPELPFGVVRPVGRGIAVLHGVHIVQGEGEVLGGFLFPIFKMGNAIRSPTVKCLFPIRIQKLDSISVRQTYRCKARFVSFLAIYSVSRSKSGFMTN